MNRLFLFLAYEQLPKSSRTDKNFFRVYPATILFLVYYTQKGLNEEQLIKSLKKDPTQFSQVYDYFYGPIFNYCLKRTADFNATKDIVSETFLKAYLNISRFKWRGISIKSWIYRIAINEIKQHYRSQQYRPTTWSELKRSELVSFDNHVLYHEQQEAEQEVDRHQQFLQIQRLVIKLPIHYQEVISLKYYEGLTIKEISAIINKPQGTVKSLLSRGINRLKQQL